MKKDNRLKVAEIFVGAGGLALGLEKVSWESVCCLKIVLNACTTLRKNKSNWKIIQEDITKFVMEISHLQLIWNN